MTEKITIDMLTSDSVSIKRQNYIEQDGVIYAVGQPSRKAYSNSIRGRAEIAQELGEPYLSAVMSVWGDTPTIEEASEE